MRVRAATGREAGSASAGSATSLTTPLSSALINHFRAPVSRTTWRRSGSEKLDGHAILESRNGIDEPVPELGTQHRRDGREIAKGHPKRVPIAVAFRIDMARTTAVDLRVAEGIVSKFHHETGHGRRRGHAQHNNQRSSESNRHAIPGTPCLAGRAAARTRESWLLMMVRLAQPRPRHMWVSFDIKPPVLVPELAGVVDADPRAGHNRTGVDALVFNPQHIPAHVLTVHPLIDRQRLTQLPRPAGQVGLPPGDATRRPHPVDAVDRLERPDQDGPQGSLPCR